MSPVTASSSDERTTRVVSASRNGAGPGERAAVEHARRGRAAGRRVGVDERLGQAEDQAVGGQRLRLEPERARRCRTPGARSWSPARGRRAGRRGGRRSRAPPRGCGPARRRRCGSRSRRGVPARPSWVSSGCRTTTWPGVLVRAAPAVVEGLHAGVGEPDGVGVVAMRVEAAAGEPRRSSLHAVRERPARHPVGPPAAHERSRPPPPAPRSVLVMRHRTRRP